MASVHIRARNLRLEIPYFEQQAVRGRSWLSTAMGAAFSPPRRRFATLLDDISFDIPRNGRVALLGRNGAGKTTLLRVLAGAFPPTSGHVEMLGSRQALLNLGLGFNTEATIVENIYLRGTAMGMGLGTIRGLVDSILEFAELEEVAGRRLSTLSSGQKMRLGFAISTSMQHDIMLMDEWFGAGDAAFVEKARKRMNDRVAGSRIVVLASHNFQMLRSVCSTGMVLEHGRLVFNGSIKDAIAAYKGIYQPAAPRAAKG